MGYFFYTLIQGFRLYVKSTFYIAAITAIIFTPCSFVWFELGLQDKALELSFEAVVWLGASTQSNLLQTTLFYAIFISLIYLPASFWVSCIVSVSLAVSNGYFPKLRGIIQTALNRSCSVFATRFIAQCIIVIPILIITFFTNRFPHILPMYGKVIIPAVAYFSFYLSLRYVFAEVIVICEHMGPIRALQLCNQITNANTLRIFLLQQAYLFGFIFINYGLFLFCHHVIHLPNDTVNWIATTLLGGINSFYMIITFYIYISFSAGEDYSQLETVAEETFA